MVDRSREQLGKQGKSGCTMLDDMAGAQGSEGTCEAKQVDRL